MFGRSGKSVEFLADWQIGDALLRIVTQARRQLVLVSPYNKHWGHLKREVVSAYSRGVAVSIYYRADEPSPADEYDGLTGVPIPMLHAKIYANEQAALVTSMNLVETSANHSREIGFLVRDARLRQEISDYISSLSENAATGASPRMAGTNRNGSARLHHVETASDIIDIVNETGFCIECRDPLTFDPGKPLCPPCYSRYGRNSVHQHCHNCGSNYSALLNQPLCPNCATTHSPRV